MQQSDGQKSRGRASDDGDVVSPTSAAGPEHRRFLVSLGSRQGVLLRMEIPIRRLAGATTEVMPAPHEDRCIGLAATKRSPEVAQSNIARSK